MFKKIWKHIKPKTEAERIEAYLSEASDMADLERRLKKLQNVNLNGWV